MPRIVKSDGTREPYNEDKLLTGFLRALEKRPVDTDSVEAAIGRIQYLLQGCGEREIASRQLGQWVMDELRSLDQVAYVRFASVYRSFEDVSEFRDEIGPGAMACTLDGIFRMEPWRDYLIEIFGDGIGFEQWLLVDHQNGHFAVR